MRIGPVTISMSRKSQPPVGEIGATGTTVLQGIVTGDEYNTDLQDSRAVDVFDKMRKSDGQVRAALLACSLPIRSAEWDIRAASQSAKDQEVAEFVYDNLFKMTITWSDLLRQILLAQVFGHYVFETVFEARNSRWWLRKLAPRLPKTIEKWWVDGSGGLKAITQRTWKNEEYVEVKIPIEKLLVFTHEREGSDYRGQSLLRAAYKHWFYKDQLYRIDAVACERHGVGLPVATLQPGASDADRKAAQEALRALRAHHKGYLIEPSTRVKFRVESMQGRALKDVLKSAEHHDTQIARSVLAEFLSIGTGGAYTGSWALHRDKSSFFLLSLKATADTLVVAPIDRYLIPRLVDYNFDVEQYPTLVYSRLESRQTKDLADSVSKLISAGAIMPDDELEESLRQDLLLPPAQRKGLPRPTPEEKKPPEKPPGEPEGSSTRERYRDLRPEERWVALAEIEDTLDGGAKAIIEAAQEVKTKQVKKLVQLGSDIMRQGRFDRIGSVDVPFKKEFVAALVPIFRDLYDRGAREVERELRKQGMKAEFALDPTDPAAAGDFLGARAQSLVSILSAKVKAAFSWELLNQSHLEEFSPTALGTRLTELSDVEMRKIGSSTASEAFNLGRASAAHRYKEEIEEAIYSAILDKATCTECEKADGRSFKVGTAEYMEYNPPYRRCLGGPKCRCLYIFRLKGEAPAVT